MSAVLLLGTVAVGLAPAGPAQAAGPSTAGTDFWITFGRNPVAVTNSLFITGAGATSGTVTWPNSSTASFTVTPGAVTTVPVPSLDPLPADGTIDTGIRITSGAPVTVYGLNYHQYTSDAYVALPTSALGTRYRALAYPAPAGAERSRLMVVGAVDGTTVTITPRNTLGARTAGEAYTVSLDAGQVYTVVASGSAPNDDVSGTLIVADKPIAAYSGVDCGNIGAGACDHQIEQLTPTQAWGTSFLAVRFDKEAGGDQLRVVADADGTEVVVGGNTVATLDAGDSYQGSILTDGGNAGVLITTSKPALVAQWMLSGVYRVDESTTASGDPSQMLLPPYQQFLSSYTLATPGSGFIFNAVNVAIPTAAIDSLRLNGDPVSAEAFAPIAGTSFSSAQLRVPDGTHNLTASQPFGAFAYGANDFNSYAYPGGAGLSPVASVANIVASPSTVAGTVGQQACLQVLVTDNGGEPVAGVRVDLTTAGANADAAADALTGDNGRVSVCYTGAAAGADTVTLTAGSASTTATVNWTAPGASPTPTTSPAPGAPSAPAKPTVIVGDSAARVQWSAPTVGAGTTITGYTVVANPGGAGCTAQADATSCVVTGLRNGTAYTFTVVANSNRGSSAPSPASEAVTPVAVASKDLRIDRPSVEPGGTVTLVARGYDPGSTVDFYLYSQPVLLGSAVANGRGVATLKVALPEDASGEHVVRAVGVDPLGRPLSQDIAVTVAAPGGGGGLPTTGSGAVVPTLATAAVLVVAGVALLLVVRRRRVVTTTDR